MPAAEQRPIIIVKKKVHGGHGHHGGAWKVAFADFVTAMMALFMVLWLVAQSPQTKSSVGAYFRDPLGVSGGGNLDINTGPRAGGAGFFSGGNTAVAVDTSMSAGNGAVQKPSKELPDLSNARSRLAQALLALRMDSWSRHVELTAVEEGLRIEIQDSKKQSLFSRGGTKLDRSAKPLLQTIASELAMLPNSLVIEGHTDATRARGRHDNWTLSTLRANEARKFLIDRGIRNDQVVEIRGYAHERPRLWHKPKDPRNRRISILVLLRRTDHDDHGSDATEPAQHPLVEKLRALDLEAQGPIRKVELAPDGSRASSP